MKRSTRSTLSTALGVGAIVAAVALTGASAAPAQAAHHHPRSLAKALAVDGDRFDRRGRDFDIVDRVLHRVLAVKPDSPVGVMTRGTQRLTAFLPTDHAFVLLVEDLTGSAPATEKAAFRTLAQTLGTETLETMLLYHLAPFATLTFEQTLLQDGVLLTMASGGNVGISVLDTGVELVDADPNDTDARVLPRLVDINLGHRQIAHGINRVLRPYDW